MQKCLHANTQTCLDASMQTCLQNYEYIGFQYKCLQYAG